MQSFQGAASDNLRTLSALRGEVGLNGNTSGKEENIAQYAVNLEKEWKPENFTGFTISLRSVLACLVFRYGPFVDTARVPRKILLC